MVKANLTELLGYRFSFEVVGHAVGVMSAGYTTELDKAGLFTKRALPRKTDILVPKELAEQLAIRHVRLDHLREHVDLRRTP